MEKYFYIIHMDGQISELENTGNRFTSTLESWTNGGIIMLPKLGIGLNSSDIRKILNADKYQSWIDSSQPRMYILDGAWYDIKDRSKPVRYEKWKLDLIESKKLPELKGVDMTPEQKVKIKEIRDSVTRKMGWN